MVRFAVVDGSVRATLDTGHPQRSLPMADPCDFCTGTHYLSDQPDMGPCVCCTPEALQRAEATLAKRNETITALTANKSLPEMLDELEGLASDVRDAHAAMTASEAEATRQVDEIKAALSNYLVEQGHPAAPIVTPPGALGELCKAADICT